MPHADRFEATYLIETSFDFLSVAREMAGEQSTSTSVRIGGETDDVVRLHGARIEAVEPLDESAAPALPSTGSGTAPWRRARVTLSWPMHNVGTSLPMLWTTLLGNQMGMRRLTGIRLEHVDLPASLVKASPRPAFGIEGTRRLSGVSGRPLIGCIVKPNIGLTPAQTAQAVRELAEGGIDFVKDDELMANPPYSPLSERVTTVMRAIEEVADRTGKKVMYAFNISDEYDAMRRHYDAVVAAGGTCVMVNINGVGLSAITGLRRLGGLPIHGHRAGWATLTRSPSLGLDFQPYQALCRLAGIDQLHVSGLGGKFWESRESVLESARHCLTPLGSTGDPDDRAMPVFSGGSTVRHAEPTFRGAGTVDLIYTCGGAIFGHPGGLAAGCRSIRESWEAATASIPVERYALDHPDLAAALAPGTRD